MTGVSYNVSGATGVASTPSATYTYDTGATSATKGLMLSVSISGQSSESYSYDSDNQLSGVTRTIGSKTYTTSYQKTTAGQLTQLTYPSSRVLNLNHDSTGRLSSIVNNGDSSNYLSSLSYNYAGQMTGWTLGSNIAETLGYDANRLQLTSQTVTQNGSTRMSLSYNYSATSGQNGSGSTAGNSGQLMSISGSIGGQTESAAYTYDNLGRLVTSNQTTNSVSAQRRFVYDRWGNRTSVYDATSGGTQIQSIALEQTSSIPTNRISSVTTNGGSPVSYSYDSNGNVTNDGSYSYQYDAENRLVSVNSGTTASYVYDHQNRRIKKVVGSTTTHYVWEGGQCIAEHNGSTGAVLTDYIYSGSRMIAREQSGNRHFFLYDRLGARATITDGQGGIQGRQATLPFGEEFNTSGTTDKHRFTSYERDSETGTDYAVNRQYNQSIGRFNRVDPLAVKLEMPQALNRYAYSVNDPINLVDSNGLDFGPGWFRNGATGSSWFCIFFPWYCAGELEFTPPVRPTREQSGTPVSPTAGWWTGLSHDQINEFYIAVDGALNLLSNAGCQSGLAKANINISKLRGALESLLAKDVAFGSSDSVRGIWNTFNGATSQHPAVIAAFNRHRSVAVVLTHGSLFLFPSFFTSTGTKKLTHALSQAIVVLHEAVHFTGLDDEGFDPNGDEIVGSHNLSNLIIHSCHSAFANYEDLDFGPP